MQTYQSHKIVEAAPIAGTCQLLSDPPQPAVRLVTGETVVVPANFTARGVPRPGDYLVRYQADGYLSWSPKAAFENGYREIVPRDPSSGRSMTFGQAIEALKNSDRVARAGWNGKGMWLALSGPLGGREIAFENFWSKPCSEFARLNGGSAVVLPTINMKTATGEILMGWLASQTDMLAEDWEVV